MAWEIVVDKDRCIGCGECVGSCPGSVLEVVDGKCEPVNEGDCLGCETCVGICSEVHERDGGDGESAISVTEND